MASGATTMKHVLRVGSVLIVLLSTNEVSAPSWAQSLSAPAVAATGVPNRDSTVGGANAGSPAKSDSFDGNPLWSVPLDTLSVTRERPIFSPTRRPTAVASVPAATTVHIPENLSEPDRPQLALIGTVIGAKVGLGVFVDDTTKSVVRLRAGDNHRGWLLRSVRGRDATLEKGDQSQTLSLPQLSAEPSKGASRRRE
jgi:hypothetical protein